MKKTDFIALAKMTLLLAALKKGHFSFGRFFIRTENEKFEFVEPIRDKKIDDMQAILPPGKFGDRNGLLFLIGINTAYRISNLRTLNLNDILEILRNKVIAKERLAMKEFDRYLFPSRNGENKPLDRESL